MLTTGDIFDEPIFSYVVGKKAGVQNSIVFIEVCFIMIAGK